MEKIEIQFFGDVSLNGLFCDPQYYQNLKKNLIDFDVQIGKPDLRVANWESPISKVFKFNPAKNPSLVTTSDSGKLFISNFNIDLACLGNNHIGDCGTEGLNSTIEFLKDHNIAFYGATNNSDEIINHKIIKIRNESFAFISFVGIETNPKIDVNDDVYINLLDEHVILRKISEIRNEVNYIIVTLHWGIEYNLFPKMNQRILAKKFIDAGANVIIGHHSHTFQGIEEYKEGIICYSLGNFVFGGLKGKENIGWPSFCNNSGAYSLFFSKSDKVKYKFHPFKVTRTGIESIDQEYNSKSIKKQIAKTKIFKVSNKLYNYYYKLNTLKIWLILLPLFLIKTKGGVFSAITYYSKPKYINVVLKYFK